MSSKLKIPAGVTEFEYRKAIEAMKRKELSASTIDAAALQADMAKRFNLSGARTSNRLTSSSSSGSNALTVSRPNNSTNNNRKICDCCRCYNAINVEVCTSCGYYLSGVPDVQETLAQKRGIAPPAVKVTTLTNMEWNAIESNIRERSDPDSCCPICMDGFNQGHEVLLSCSHMFHRSCLTSFEKFMKNGLLTCPICRYCHNCCLFYLFGWLLLISIVTEPLITRKRSHTSAHNLIKPCVRKRFKPCGEDITADSGPRRSCACSTARGGVTRRCARNTTRRR